MRLPFSAFTDAKRLASAVTLFIRYPAIAFAAVAGTVFIFRTIVRLQ